MALIQNIFEIESVRNTPLQCRQIHLFLEGTFFHAYEWSAWLVTKYIKALSVSRKLNKAVKTDYVMVGFPADAIAKYTPSDAVTITDEKDEKHIILTLPETLVADTDARTMTETYKNWRDTVPMTEAKEKNTGVLADHPVTLTGIMKLVLDYEIEEHSLRETEQFLKDIKHKLIRIL